MSYRIWDNSSLSPGFYSDQYLELIQQVVHALSSVALGMDVLSCILSEVSFCVSSGFNDSFCSLSWAAFLLSCIDSVWPVLLCDGLVSNSFFGLLLGGLLIATLMVCPSRMVLSSPKTAHDASFFKQTNNKIKKHQYCGDSEIMVPYNSCRGLFTIHMMESTLLKVVCVLLLYVLHLNLINTVVYC